jgi:cellulose biosynthesis protein BcsQ
MYADYCVIPFAPDLLSIVGVRGTLFFLENVEKASKSNVCKVLGVLPTLYDQRRSVDQTILDDAQRLANADLLRGGIVFDPIRTDTKVKTAQVKRKLLSEAFPASKAAADYQKFCDDLLARIEFLEKQDVQPSKIVKAHKPARTVKAEARL